MHSSAAGKLREGGLLQLDTIQDCLYKLNMKPFKLLKSVHCRNTVKRFYVSSNKIVIIFNNTLNDFVLISADVLFKII